MYIFDLFDLLTPTSKSNALDIQGVQTVSKRGKMPPLPKKHWYIRTFINMLNEWFYNWVVQTNLLQTNWEKHEIQLDTSQKGKLKIG